MRKKILVCLCTFALAIGLVACGNSSDDTVGGRTPRSYQEELTSLFGELVTMSDDEIESSISYLSGYEQGAVLVGLLDNYVEYHGEAGDFIEFGDFEVAKSGKTITATLIGDFTNRDLKMTFVYSTLDTDTPTAMNIEPIYSTGEKMQKAALNTVMGILIVFCMLVVMSGVIKCFEIIPKLQNNAKEKKEDEPVIQAPVAVARTETVKNDTDDLQLVAVIAAAIAASTGASTDSFVVRSIKKRH